MMLTNEHCMMMLAVVFVLILCFKTDVLGGRRWRRNRHSGHSSSSGHSGQSNWRPRGRWSRRRRGGGETEEIDY